MNILLIIFRIITTPQLWVAIQAIIALIQALKPAQKSDVVSRVQNAATAMQASGDKVCFICALEKVLADIKAAS